MVVLLTFLTGLGLSTPIAATAEGWKLPRLGLWPGQQEPADRQQSRRGAEQASFEDPVEPDLASFDIRPRWPGLRLDLPTPTQSLNAGIDTLKAGSRKLQQGAVQLHSETKRMWNSTRITLTAPFAANPDRGPQRPSMWSKLFGPAEDEQPQTVRQFLSQERP
jgi:X-X-X-Leu-X-X-Gly heptad repeat protein